LSWGNVKRRYHVQSCIAAMSHKLCYVTMLEIITLLPLLIHITG
jgi:hypothetical protein